MNRALNNLQKYLFILLIYLTGFSAFVWDLLKMTSKTALYLSYDILIISLAILSFSYMRSRLIYIVLFILSGIVMNLTYSETSLFQSFNGIREILLVIAAVIFFNKIFAKGNEALVEEYITIMKNFAWVFLIVNVPIALSQYLINGPTDAVGGSYGYGGSGVLTLSIICLVYFMQLHYQGRFVLSAILFLTLVPLFWNETKVSFILIPALIFVLKVKPKLGNILLAVGGAILFFFIFNHFFAATFLDFDNSASGIFSKDFLSDYLAADVSVYNDIPRITKIVLAWNMMLDNITVMFFGFEYGIFRGGNSVDLSQFTITNQWMLFGTRPYVFFLMTQGGLFLVVGFFALAFHANNFLRNSNKFQWFLFGLLMLIMVYNDTFRNHCFVISFFFMVFFARSPAYRKLVGDEPMEENEVETPEIPEPVNYRE